MLISKKTQIQFIKPHKCIAVRKIRDAGISVTRFVCFIMHTHCSLRCLLGEAVFFTALNELTLSVETKQVGSLFVIMLSFIKILMTFFLLLCTRWCNCVFLLAEI